MECVECGRRWTQSSPTGRPRRYCSRSCQGRAYRRRRDDGRLSQAVSPLAGDKRSATVLATAVSMADDAGIRVITLRAVAAQIDRPLAALQRNFGSRDRLVAAMVQHVLAAHPGPVVAPDDPVDALTTLAEHEWRAYEAHPWLVRVMASTRPPLVPAVLETSRAAIEVFTSIGLDPEAALDRYLALSAYIQGMGLLVLTEREEAGRTGTSGRAWWAQEVRRLARTGATGRHPWLSELTEQRRDEAFDASACFRDGLHRVVTGLVAST